jgi:hypothetical protein
MYNDKELEALSILADEALREKEDSESTLLFLSDLALKQKNTAKSRVPSEIQPGVKISVRFQYENTKEYIFCEGIVLKTESRGKDGYVYVNYKDADGEITWKHIISEDFVYKIHDIEQKPSTEQLSDTSKKSKLINSYNG